MALTFEDPEEQAKYQAVHNELRGTLASALRGNMAIYSEVMGLFDTLETMAFLAGAKVGGFVPDVAPSEQFSTLDVANQPAPVFPDVPTRPERPAVMPSSKPAADMGWIASTDVQEMPEVVERLREAIGDLQSQGWQPASWEELILAVSNSTLIQAHTVDQQLIDTPMGRSVIRNLGLEEHVLRVGPPPVVLLDEPEAEAS